MFFIIDATKDPQQPGIFTINLRERFYEPHAIVIHSVALYGVLQSCTFIGAPADAYVMLQFDRWRLYEDSVPVSRVDTSSGTVVDTSKVEHGFPVPITASVYCVSRYTQRDHAVWYAPDERTNYIEQFSFVANGPEGLPGKWTRIVVHAELVGARSARQIERQIVAGGSEEATMSDESTVALANRFNSACSLSYERP